LGKEQDILNRLSERFCDLNVKEATVSRRRIFVEVPSQWFLELIRFAKEYLGFAHLSTITGLDEGDRFIVIYHLSKADGIVLNIKVPVPKDDPVIASVLPFYDGAIFYEREVEGLLGIRVQGLPEGRQYPLPDNWPKGQYPLRKDWKPDILKNNKI
jgi:membrane-bound hydrogenase subunit beta